MVECVASWWNMMVLDGGICCLVVEYVASWWNMLLHGGILCCCLVLTFLFSSLRKKDIGDAKEGKRKFDRQTTKFCTQLEKYCSLTTKKNDATLQEADAVLDMERRAFYSASMDYVLMLQKVQEKKKFEFVETLLRFMYAWLTFYHQVRLRLLTRE